MRNVSLKFPTLNRKTGECLLAAVVIARATSFLFSKLLLESMTPTNLLAVRFLIAFALLAILFRKKLFEVFLGSCPLSLRDEEHNFVVRLKR